MTTNPGNAGHEGARPYIRPESAVLDGSARHNRAEPTRRSFLAATAAIAGLVLPGWGQRVFPMYPRVHTIRLDDELFWGRGLELRLPWWKMREYVAQLRRESPGCCRTADGKFHTPHVLRTYDELLAEGWEARELAIDPIDQAIDRAIVREAMCKKRIHLPTVADATRFALVPSTHRRLVVPIRALDTGPDGHADWVLDRKIYAGGMISGMWRDRTAEAT